MRTRWRAAVAAVALGALSSAATLAHAPGEGVLVQASPASQSPEEQEIRAALARIQALIRDARFSDAEAAARALISRVEAAEPESPLVADTLDLLSEALWRGGRSSSTPEARQAAERAVAIRERALGPDHPDVARSLTNLGALLHESGDYQIARMHLERALAIREIALGPDHPDVARSANSLANLLRSIGDFASARALYERTVRIWERAAGPDDPALAGALNNLAIVIDDFGDYAGAKPLYERALAIWEKANGPNHRTVGQGLNNLGLLLYHQADYAGAIPMLERALAIREQVFGPEHPQVAQAFNNLASVVRDAGEYARARPLAERGLAIREKVLGPEHPITSNSVTDLALIVHAMGDNAEAERLFERALSIRERSYGPDHPIIGETLAGLARVRAELGETNDAVAAALRAERLGAEHLGLMAQTLPERQALSYAARRPSGLDVLLSLAARRPLPGQTLRQIWEAVIRVRAQVLDEMAARHRASGAADDPEVARLVAQLAAARERLARLVVRGPGQNTASYSVELAALSQEKERAERLLAEASLTFRHEQARQRSGLAELSAALAPDAALVAYVAYQELPLGAPRGGKRPEPVPSYLAFVLPGSNRSPQVVPLGPAREIDGLVAAWREQMAREAMAPGRAGRRTEISYRRAASVLKRQIWDPVARHLEGASRLFVVPDRSLHLVNFAALPAGTRYLVDAGPLVHYLSAERDLVTDPEPPGTGLLALGDPAFDDATLFARRAGAGSPRVAIAGGAHAEPSKGVFRGVRSACGNFQTMRFDPLPASAHEVATITGLWKEGAGGRLQSREPLQLRGRAATEAAFKTNASGRRVLHVATHGFFLGGRCASAADAARPEAGRIASGAGENPLLLSGLVLAGANHRQVAGPDEEDGVLTAEEIAALDLRGVEWAVLSACDTGVGEVRAGEGVFGLRRAFRAAGAGTVIMSLWPVEDAAAMLWMSHLYEQRFTHGRPTAESVQQANLASLRERRQKGLSTHPFYWAGFVAAGNWR